MNQRLVWIVVIVIIILELWFCAWTELSIRYLESGYKYEPSVPFIWYTTDQS
jgi:hypothetical protein